MSGPSVMHATIVVERRYRSAPEKVFAAWADPVARRQWDNPGGDDWETVEQQQDFRVGGRETSRFGPKGDARFWSDGHYLDIVPDVRIVSAGTMHEGATRISSTLCTIEVMREGNGTKLVLTDQSAFLDGRETPAERKSGWGAILDRLGLYVDAGEA